MRPPIWELLLPFSLCVFFWLSEKDSSRKLSLLLYMCTLRANSLRVLSNTGILQNTKPVLVSYSARGEQMYIVEISLLASCKFSVIKFLAIVPAFWHFHESIPLKEIEKKENSII